VSISSDFLASDIGLIVSAGRLKYFYSTTSPLTLLASSAKLEQAQSSVQRYERLIKERGREGCWVGEKERDEYWNAKQCALLSYEPRRAQLTL
jgi:hypothetical protein